MRSDRSRCFSGPRLAGARSVARLAKESPSHNKFLGCEVTADFYDHDGPGDGYAAFRGSFVGRSPTTGWAARKLGKGEAFLACTRVKLGADRGLSRRRCAQGRLCGRAFLCF